MMMNYVYLRYVKETLYYGCIDTFFRSPYICQGGVTTWLEVEVLHNGIAEFYIESSRKIYGENACTMATMNVRIMENLRGEHMNHATMIVYIMRGEHVHHGYDDCLDYGELMKRTHASCPAYYDLIVSTVSLS